MLGLYFASKDHKTKFSTRKLSPRDNFYANFPLQHGEIIPNIRPVQWLHRNKQVIKCWFLYWLHGRMGIYIYRPCMDFTSSWYKVSDSNGGEVDYYVLFVRICCWICWMWGKILELSWFYSQHHYIVNQKDFARDLLSFASLTILLEIITAIFCMINTIKNIKIFLWPLLCI